MPSLDVSTSASLPSSSRERGPATFTAAREPVRLTISTSSPQTAFHHSNHSITVSAPVEVVVT